MLHSIIIVITIYTFYRFTDVQRGNGVFQRYMGYLEREDVLPMTYTIMEAYVRTDFNLLPARNIDIVCTLRGGPADPARDRVRRWVEEYGKSRELKSYIAGEVNHASRYSPLQNMIFRMLL